jgi:acyl-CoA thioesterase-1
VTEFLSCLVRAATVGAGLVLMPLPAAAQDAAAGQRPATPQSLAACVAPPHFGHFVKPLAHVAARLRSGQPITIVAFGSSSTAGAGASSPAMSYPSRLEAELLKRFPQAQITVLNRGVNGEEASEMLRRIDLSVIAEKPDLVLWQVGTNAVLRDPDVGDEAPLIHQGLMRFKEAGIDIVLIDPQYAPKVLAKPEAEHMVKLIAMTAKQDDVDLFNRFAVMRYWHDDQNLPFESFLSPDLLHMNDWSYACVAKLLAADISEATTRGPLTAGAHSSAAGRQLVGNSPY